MGTKRNGRPMISLLLVLLVAGAQAHLCLLSPAPRTLLGSTGLNTAGAGECALTGTVCGGEAPQVPYQAVYGGTQIVFQKNLDHYNKANPGNFTIEFSLLPEPNLSWKMIATVPDTPDKSLSLYSVLSPIPNPNTNISPHGVLRVTYNTNNPQAPPQFVMCADVAFKN